MPTDVQYRQFEFGGGMNVLSEIHRIGVDEFGEAFNIRGREGSLEAIKRPLKDEKAPAGLKQGIYGFDKYLVLFNAGFAWYKDMSETSTTDKWTVIGGFQLSKAAHRVYTQAVPASTVNFMRKLIDSSRLNGTTSEVSVAMDPAITVAGTLGGLICQDGITQPFIILPDGTAVRTKNYTQWTTDNREYVPIGKQMAFINGILFIAAPDGKTIYRSVSARPLDFVVNIDQQGNKGGNADTVSYAVSYAPVTGMFPLASGELLVTTEYTLHQIEFDEVNTIFGEPQFMNRKIQVSGCMNQFSFVELLNDYAFIDRDGLRSFSAIVNLNNEGRNSIFSQKVNKLVANTAQREATSCGVVFNNYAFFSVLTKHGYVVLVYDLLTEKWRSIDSYGIGAIKQFAITTASDNPRLFAITENHIYELFASPANLTAQVRFVDVVDQDKAKTELKMNNVSAVFTESNTEESVECECYSDGKVGESVSRKLSNTFTGIRYPAHYPVSYSDTSRVDNLLFNFGLRGKIGWSTGIRLTWKNNAKLSLIQYEAEKQTMVQSVNTGARAHAR